MREIDTSHLTYDEAMKLILQLWKQFEWKGMFFSRGDAARIWETRYGRDMTDADWERVKETHAWKTLRHALTRPGLAMMRAAVEEVAADAGHD